MTTGRINQVAPSHFKGHSKFSLAESHPEHPSSQRDVEIYHVKLLYLLHPQEGIRARTRYMPRTCKRNADIKRNGRWWMQDPQSGKMGHPTESHCTEAARELATTPQPARMAKASSPTTATMNRQRGENKNKTLLEMAPQTLPAPQQGHLGVHPDSSNSGPRAPAATSMQRQTKEKNGERPTPQTLSLSLSKIPPNRPRPAPRPPRSPPGQQQRWTSIPRSPAATSMRRQSK